MQAIEGGRARLEYDAGSDDAAASGRWMATAGSSALALKELNPCDRPREKLMRAGVAGLGDNEIIAVLLGSGVPSNGALAMARDVLAMADGIGGLSRLEVTDLARITGIGTSRAARLVAAVELSRRMGRARWGDRPRFMTSGQVAEYLSPLFGGHRVERFGIVMLDAKSRLIRATILFVGSLDVSIVHPREVFREAMTASAAAIVAFHNHPSGDPQPSPEDRWLTQRLIAAGEVVGIPLLDHIILGDGRWFSFKEAAARLRPSADKLDTSL